MHLHCCWEVHEHGRGRCSACVMCSARVTSRATCLTSRCKQPAALRLACDSNMLIKSGSGFTESGLATDSMAMMVNDIPVLHLLHLSTGKVQLSGIITQLTASSDFQSPFTAVLLSGSVMSVQTSLFWPVNSFPSFIRFCSWLPLSLAERTPLHLSDCLAVHASLFCSACPTYSVTPSHTYWVGHHGWALLSSLHPSYRPPQTTPALAKLGAED